VARAFAVLVGLFLLVVAGCGSSPKSVSKAEYQATLQKLGTDLTDAGSQLGKAIDRATFNRNVQNLQDHLRDAAHQLRGLRPPENVRAANDQLARALRDFADELEPVKEARRQSIIKARDALARVGRSSAIKEGRDALRKLKRNGYDVGEFGTL